MAGKYLSLLVHFTWSTARREPWLEMEMREDLYSYIGGIMKNKKAKLIAAGGVCDHVHLYASLPSTISVADFVNAVKSNSSRWVHESYSRLRNFAWQDGYGAFSVSKIGTRKSCAIHQKSGKSSSQANFQRGIRWTA